VASDHAHVDWPTYPLQTPSGGGRAPTPDRSETPAKGFLASGQEGLTNQGPLQKSAISVAHCAAPSQAALRERAVLVRHFAAPRISDFLRITIGSEPDLGRLTEALSEILAETR